MANLSKSNDTRKRVSEILSAGVISEKDLNLLKNRINHRLCEYEDIEPLFLDYVTLNDEQTAKGIKWLRNLYKTPAGKERKNNLSGLVKFQYLKAKI